LKQIGLSILKNQLFDFLDFVNNSIDDQAIGNKLLALFQEFGADGENVWFEDISHTSCTTFLIASTSASM